MGILTKLVMISFLLSSTIVEAGSKVKFSLIPTTPVNIQVTENTGAIVQYQVTNNLKKTHTLTMLPINGISQLTNGPGLCANPFTLAFDESCLLTLKLNASELSDGFTESPTICSTSGPNSPSPLPYLCSRSSQSNQLQISKTTANQPLAIMANSNNYTVTTCKIDAITGLLSACVVSSAPGIFSRPLDVALNASKTRAYVANGVGNTVSICDFSIATQQLTNCVNSTGGALLVGPDGIAFNPTYTKIYIGNYTNKKIIVCDVNSQTGALSNCAQTGSGFGNIVGLRMNLSGNRMYVGNHNSTVSVCTVDLNTGLLSQCTINSSLYSATSYIAFNMDNTKAYITSANTKTVVCNVAASTGFISSCMDALTSGPNTFGIQLNWLNTKAYIVEYVSGTVKVCNVNPDSGVLSNCVASGSGMSSPVGLTLID